MTSHKIHNKHIVMEYVLTLEAKTFMWVLGELVLPSSNCGKSFEYTPTMNFFFKVASLLQMLENVGLCEGSSIQHSSIKVVSSSQLIGSSGLPPSFIICKITSLFSMSTNGSFKERISEHVIPNDHTSAGKGHAVFEHDLFLLLFISGAMYFVVPMVNSCNSGLLWTSVLEVS